MLFNQTPWEGPFSADTDTLSTGTSRPSGEDNILQVYTDETPYVINEPLRITLAVLLIPICIAGIAGNALVLMALVLNRRMRNISSGFLANLVICDLLQCDISFPYMLHNLLQKGDINPSQTGCMVLNLLHNMLALASQFTLAVIAHDRYQAIHNCMEYSSSVTQLSYVIKGFIFVWTQTVLYTIPALMLPDGHGEVAYQSSRFLCTITYGETWWYSLVVFFLCFCQTLCIMGFCYTKVMLIAKQHLRQIADINNATKIPLRRSIDPHGALAFAMVDPIQRLTLCPQAGLQAQAAEDPAGDNNTSGRNKENNEGDNISSVSTISSVGTHFRRSVKATAKLLGLISVYLVCWLPFHVVNLTQAFSQTAQVPYCVSAIATALTFVNSALNPYLYAVGSRRFRSSIRKILLGRKKNKSTKKKTTKKSGKRMRRKRREVLAQIASLYPDSGSKHSAGNKSEVPGSNFDPEKICSQAHSTFNGSDAFSEQQEEDIIVGCGAKGKKRVHELTGYVNSAQPSRAASGLPTISQQVE